MFLFEKYLTHLNKAFKELEDAGQALWETQEVTHLLKGIQNDDIQVQMTISIVRNSFLSHFDVAFLTLSRTVLSRFASVLKSNRQKRRIGAVDTRGKGNWSGRGRGRAGRHYGSRGGRRENNWMKVIMNGLDVTDITRNFTLDKWDKLHVCGGRAYVTQGREYLSGRHGGRGDNRGGREGRSCNKDGQYNDNASNNSNEQRNVSANNTTNTTEIR